MKRLLVSHRSMFLVGFGLATLVGITLWQLQVQSVSLLARAMSEDVLLIQGILRTIDEQCEIVEIFHDRNYIDFLSVSKFAGSRVGPLKLKKPEAWQGPYLLKMPIAQGKMYELVKMRDGYGIVPGAGVKLPNHKIVGTDVVFDRSSDIDTYLTAEAGLEYEGKPLIAKFVPRFQEVRTIERPGF